MGIFFGANGKKAAGGKKGWMTDKEAVKRANKGSQTTQFAIARAQYKAKKRGK